MQIGAKLWLVGGCVQRVGNVTRAGVLDLRTLAWRSAPDLPAAIHGCTIAAYGEDVLALGNQIDGQRAWILRAGADSWAPLSDAPEARLLAVGVATAAGTSKTRAFVIFGDRARVDVPVFGYVKSGDV